MNKDDTKFLQEISENDLENLRDVYKENWPYNIHLYNFIDNYVKWNKKKLKHRLKFYILDNKWDDGTFIAIDDEFNYHIIVSTLEPNCARLSKTLKETKLINWPREPFFSVLNKNLYPAVNEVLSFKRLGVAVEDGCSTWWMPAKKALEFDVLCPPELYTASLNESHLKEINSLWPLKSDYSFDYLRQLIKYNMSAGLFLKENDDLCTWIMQNNYGILGTLQTKNEYKKRGYGKLATKILSKQFAKRGMDVAVFILNDNTVSQQLFKSLGFEKVEPLRWIYTKKI